MPRTQLGICITSISIHHVSGQKRHNNIDACVDCSRVSQRCRRCNRYRKHALRLAADGTLLPMVHVAVRSRDHDMLFTSEFVVSYDIPGSLLLGICGDLGGSGDWWEPAHSPNFGRPACICELVLP